MTEDDSTSGEFFLKYVIYAFKNANLAYVSIEWGERGRVLAVLALVLAVLELVLAVLALVMIILVQIIDSALPFQWTAFSDNRVFYRVGPVLIQGRRGDNKGNAN